MACLEHEDHYSKEMPCRMCALLTDGKLKDAVIDAAIIYRQHMLGEIEPVQACGMRLDEAIDDLAQDRHDPPEAK